MAAAVLSACSPSTRAPYAFCDVDPHPRHGGRTVPCEIAGRLGNIIDLSVADGTPYWSDKTGGAITRRRTDGTVETFAKTINEPSALALDATSVMWLECPNTAHGVGTVFRRTKDGGATTSLMTELPSPLALAAADDAAFASTNSWPGIPAIWRVPFSGQPQKAWSQMGQEIALGLRPDATESILWVLTTTEVFRLPLDGSPATVIHTAPNAGGASLVRDATSVFWTDGASQVLRAPLDGGAVAIIASGQAAPRGLAVDEAAVYWVNGGDPSGTGAGSIMRAPLDGGAPEQLVSDPGFLDRLVADASSIYWTNLGTYHADARIMRLDKE